MQNNEISKIENIKPITMYDEMSSSYLSYAMSVIISRALPDIRDGLKPVHRRIIYAMHKGGFDWTKHYRKSARIVGDVIGKYHPHGDQAVYDALVRMVQDFSMSLPLIDGQGNFGSIDGDPPAAMRYTETRLSKISQYLIDDIEKNTVKYRSNYDETEKEPTVLPAQYPNLLVNGAGGIAVGMATSIPPHNLGEVIDGALALIDNKDIKLNELMKYIPGPDFPTGGIIIGKDIIKQGLKEFKGVQRRFNKIFKYRETEFYDDYAHHPTEIKEVLNGVKEVYKNKEIVCVFQPHRISRVKNLKKEFSLAFKKADTVVLCPIYKAGENISLGFTYSNFAREIIKNSNIKLILIKNNLDLAKFVKQNIYGDKIVIGMGAGSISNWMRKLPKLL